MVWFDCVARVDEEVVEEEVVDEEAVDEEVVDEEVVDEEVADEEVVDEEVVDEEVVDEEVVGCTVWLSDGVMPGSVAFATVSEEVYLGRIQKNSAIVKT